ncbi:MAG TPA: hypothetical protein VLD58_05450 [Gemmatimonadales bacterium]|nr:hypothetical protein [Gemmatimonadales bacterium]
MPSPGPDESIGPGVVASSLGHGRWTHGAEDVVIDGQGVKGDRRRGGGIHANAALRVDGRWGTPRSAT